MAQTIVCVKVDNYVAVVTAVNDSDESSADLLAAFTGL